jgi:hypothetical protein
MFHQVSIDLFAIDFFAPQCSLSISDQAYECAYNDVYLNKDENSSETSFVIF